MSPFFMMIFPIVLLIISQTVNAEVGDYCKDPKTGSDGKCVLVEHCESARKLLMKRKHHGLQRCGFSGIFEIVCCIDMFSQTKNPNTRKSAIACNSFEHANQLVLDPFIFGGENATLGEFPHMAALGYPSDNSTEMSWLCGGSLISETYVLTAAHCIIDRNVPVVIRLGKVDLYGNSDGVEAQDIPVDKIIPHDDYNIRDKLNDIGLIRLARPAQLSKNVKPVCLYTKEDDPKKLEVCGWGKVNNTGQTYRFLQKTSLQPVAVNECNATISREVLTKPVFETQLCAISNDTVARDTCQGDSGGPIQYATQRIVGNPLTNTYFLVGVTSYGRGCGGSLPSIYTRVVKFLDWIEDKVWPL